ncbi:nuclear pore complex protein Nup153 isoform X2 [Prorops nasuta]|uniref:nuclear pore complex protein Nup153 isoform X2 n=1 Tax=Prorops nasuta TaxID=863751 RepID=UPI0034CE4959
MAKGSNDLAGRRQSSHNTKPYDANNSFVRKVATKVTDFIPQRSWISKWFNTSETDVDDETQQPPPLKRPRIRMDITHPPGTFSIQPRRPSFHSKPDTSKDDYSIHNDTTDDFLQPMTAGPSGLGRLISSTPAVHNDVGTISEHRSELNTLVSAQNNGAANGMDDNSESSESTSGCSSLIPQTNRQETPSNAGYNSAFNSRKRFTDNKLNFSNHLQSPKSLFLSSTSRDSLSSRRPSFNASMLTNSFERSSSPLSSPFYSGNTTFGGANAAGLYKRGGSLLSDTNRYQLKVPKRTSITVKPTNTSTVDSSGMSQTAKRILEALEHFSSPISDAKRIPIRDTSFDSPVLNKKRPRDEENASTPKVGLRHLTRALNVPTVPDMLKLRRRQRLQDSTAVARRIVSERNTAPPPPQEYRLRSEDNDSTKLGKAKRKATGKKKIEEEESIEPVNLPNVPLPVTTLPNFDIALPQYIVKKNCLNKEDTFKFANPIKVTESTKNLKSINNFTFSIPISAKDRESLSKSTESDELSNMTNMKSNTSTISSSTPTSMPNFIWSESSTAPRPKEKVISKDSPTILMNTAKDLKLGSVIDVRVDNISKTESNSNIFGTSSITDKKSSDIMIFDSVSDINKSDSWECSECLIKNNNTETHCVACKIAKDKADRDSKSLSMSLNSEIPSKPAVNDNFGSQFKIAKNQWECNSCWVRNEVSNTKCCVCEAPKPSQRLTIQPSSPLSSKDVPANNDLMAKFKPMEGSWECPGCMLRNSETVITCPCCNASKPTLTKTISKKTTTTNITTETDVAKTIDITTESSLTKNAPSLADQFKPSKPTWECPSCMVRNADSIVECVCCNTSKPGSKQQPSKTSESETSQKSNVSSLQFNFGMPANAGEFKFGIDKADTKTTTDTIPCANGFKFGEKQTAVMEGFTFGIPKDSKPATSPAETKVDTDAAIFSVNTKNTVESTTEKKISETENKAGPAFTFGIPQQKESNPTTQQSSAINISQPQPVFTFGSQKTETSQSTTGNSETLKGLFGNTAGEISKIENKIVAPKPDTPVNTNLSQIETPKTTTAPEIKPLPAFSFIATTTTASNNISNSTTNIATTSLPAFNQSSFTFSEQKTTVPQTTVPTPFAQVPQSTSTAPLFSFGTNKTNETHDEPTAKKPASGFGGSSNSPGFFQPLFKAAKPPTFGIPEAKAEGLGFASNPTPTFGSSTPATNLFSTTKPCESNPTSSGLFAFGASSSQTPAPTPTPTANFNFPTANTNPPATNQKLFSFGSNNQPPAPSQTNSVFGSTAFNAHAPSTTTGFRFNAPKPEAPSFGQPAAATTPFFGAAPNSAQQPSSSFAAAPTSNAVFNFGSSTATGPAPGSTQVAPSGGFNFGGAPQNPPPSSGFNFNAPNSGSTVTFDPNAAPVYNFTAGNAPPTFSGNPRVIKKAVRRRQRDAQH